MLEIISVYFQRVLYSYRSKMLKVLILFVELINVLSSPIFIENQTSIFSTTELALDDDSAETIYKDTDYLYEEDYNNNQMTNISFHDNHKLLNIEFQNLMVANNKTTQEVSYNLRNRL